MAHVELPHFTHVAATAKPQSGAISRVCTVGNLVIAHWAMFWMMNGFDKFFHRTDLGLFAWHGKDRTEQFTGYLTNTNMPVTWLEPLLLGTGILQLIITIPLLMVLGTSLRGRWVSRDLFEMSFFLGGAMLMGFSGFDIIFGDRMELWEHGTFLVGLLLSYKLAKDSFQERGLIETNS